MLDKFKSRKFLLALVGQIAGIIVLFFPDKQSDIITASQYVGGLLVMALTAIGYMVAEAKVDQAGVHADAATEQTKIMADAKQSGTTDGSSSGSTTGLLILLLAGLALSFGGCAATPQTRWAQARESLTSATQLATLAAKQGYMDDKQIVAVDTAIQAARAALTVAETQLPNGGQTFESYMDIASAVLEKLTELLMPVQTTKEQTDGPATGYYLDPGRQRSYQRSFEATGALASVRRPDARTDCRCEIACGDRRFRMGSDCGRGAPTHQYAGIPRQWMMAA